MFTKLKEYKYIKRIKKREECCTKHSSLKQINNPKKHKNYINTCVIISFVQ